MVPLPLIDVALIITKPPPAAPLDANPDPGEPVALLVVPAPPPPPKINLEGLALPEEAGATFTAAGSNEKPAITTATTNSTI